MIYFISLKQLKHLCHIKKIKPNENKSASPSVTNQEIKLVTHATKIGWRDKRDYYTNKFNKEFKALTKIKYCLPVSLINDATHLAMIAIGIRPGDEVIVPDVTWVASATPITYLGGKPVFADINEENLCIDHNKIEKLITKNKSYSWCKFIWKLSKLEIKRFVINIHYI